MRAHLLEVNLVILVLVERVEDATQGLELLLLVILAPLHTRARIVGEMTNTIRDNATKRGTHETEAAAETPLASSTLLRLPMRDHLP